MQAKTRTHPLGIVETESLVNDWLQRPEGE